MDKKVMYTVKLTFNFDWPIFRQTPRNFGIWDDYQFIIDPNLSECDFWVIYSEYKLIEERCKCNKENIFFLPAECYNTSARYPAKFLEQFGKIITVQKEIQGKNVIHHQNANPWFIEKNYDELVELKPFRKTKLMSIVSSDKAFTEGHRKRLDFAKKIKEYFGDSVDLFGRGLNPFEKKWDTLADYKYHIAIENDSCDDWVTEKFFDPILAYSYPFYYGCPNIHKYISEKSFTRIDINNFNQSIEIIESIIGNDSIYNDFIDNSKIYRDVLLNEQQLFPMLCSFLKQNAHLVDRKKINIISGLEKYEAKQNYLERLLGKIKF
ncbi:MAG: hypothetical protein IKD55_06340 [Sediminibacterium sp.]|nr:hypothetical protein [Sediminibacterium sp.]